MLVNIAKKVFDQWLPDVIYEDATLDDIADESNKSPEAEEILAMSLGFKLDEVKANSKRARDEDEGRGW